MTGSGTPQFSMRVSPRVSALRSAIYLRVSTGRQAEHDLSIPDQRAQTQAWVIQRGWSVVAEYVEPGASATDDKRPEFQRMIERACDGDNAFDVIAALEREAHEANERLRRLYKLIEDGVAELDDILKDRIIALKADRDGARAAMERARSGVRPPMDISPIVVERFGTAMREKLTNGEVPFRKAYVGSLVDRIEVDDCQIRIVGRKDVLEQAVLANGGSVPGVRSFVRKWRTGQDSNPRPPDS